LRWYKRFLDDMRGNAARKQQLVEQVTSRIEQLGQGDGSSWAGLHVCNLGEVQERYLRRYAEELLAARKQQFERLDKAFELLASDMLTPVGDEIQPQIGKAMAKGALSYVTRQLKSAADKANAGIVIDEIEVIGKEIERADQARRAHNLKRWISLYRVWISNAMTGERRQGTDLFDRVTVGSLTDLIVLEGVSVVHDLAASA